MYLSALFLLCMQPPHYSDNQRKVSIDGMVKLDPFGVQLLERADVRKYLDLEPWQDVQLSMAREYYHKHNEEMGRQIKAAMQDQYQLSVLQQRVNLTRDSLQKDVAIILTPEQIAGLFKIKMQVIQYPLIFKSELLKALSVKPDQIAKHTELQQQYDLALEKAVSALGTVGREKKLEAVIKAHQQHYPIYLNGVTQILTNWQKEQFDALCCKQIKLEPANFHAEGVLPLIENKLMPRTIPRIVEPFPIAEIAMNSKARQYLDLNQYADQITKLAGSWIQDETDFYQSLRQIKQDDRENVLKDWYGKRLKNHSTFLFDLKKVIGQSNVEKLVIFQLQLRGLTVLGDKTIRTQLGITDDQYNELMRMNTRKIYEDAAKTKIKEKQLYMRMPAKMEAMWISHFSEEQQVLWENLLGKKIPDQLLNQVGDEIVKAQSARVPESDFLKGGTR